MQTYKLTDEELEEVRQASTPVPYMIVGGVEPRSPRENVMVVWRRVASRVGCNLYTIVPAETGDDHDFMAVPKV